ncbi:glycoside hydrolase family 127 protein [Promicromonospora sukumoe]|uniref:glycoside hydrolase family 127 protein n=1 Tax=Promicromonospora sukumoe TaxID=88382 RepID=UPI0037C566CE
MLFPTGHRGAATPAPVVPSTGRLTPLGLDQVRITGGPWARRQEVNATATLAHIEHWLEREGWLGNFDLAVAGGLAGELAEKRRGREFSDSEVYKLLEAMAWELGRRPDDDLQERFDAIVLRVAAAQEPDGYIGTRFGRPGQQPRYTDLEWGHELYCQGHLYQAAAARARTGKPDDLLVDVARRSADHVCATFGPAGNQGICGHSEIELGLAELGRALGEPRYLAQAALFVERHGHGTLADIEFGRSYYQDVVPVRDSEVLHGHAVRANYLAAGAVDVAVETGDTGLLDAVAGQWARAQARRTYVTGGQGSHHQDEAFGDDWVLPPDRAYSETCASVGSVMVSWRLLLARGGVEYADAIERALTNVVATSPAHDGQSFFYANTLHQRVPAEHVAADVVSKRAEASLRAPWFEVSCCPPNVARTFASLAAYVATVDDGGVQLHQYAPAEIRAELPSGERVGLDVVTDYPATGRVEVRVVEAPAGDWTLTLRVPAWSGVARVRVGSGDGVGGVGGADAGVGGAGVDVGVGDGSGAGVGVDDGVRGDGDEAVREVGPGLVAVAGPRTGGVVVLDLDAAPRFVVPDPHIDAVRGCVVVQRGPEVLCLESVDLESVGLGAGADGSGGGVDDVVVDTSVPPWEVNGTVYVRAGLLGAGAGADAGGAAAARTGADADAAGAGDSGDNTADADAGWPYKAADDVVPHPRPELHDVPLVAYHDWANRGPATMRVWLPTL